MGRRAGFTGAARDQRPGRTVFAGQRMQARHGERAGFPGGVDLVIRDSSGSRWPARGAGKFTLLRLISGEQEPSDDGKDGTAKRAFGQVASLSAKLDLLHPERSVAASLAAFAPAMPHEQRMNLLARFLFRGARAHLPARGAVRR